MLLYTLGSNGAWQVVNKGVEDGLECREGRVGVEQLAGFCNNISGRK